MKRCFLLAAALLPVPLRAHMVSMSTGEVRIETNRLYYGLRMPLYEIAHVRDPSRALLEHLHFRSGGAEARMVEKSCREDTANGAFLCTATYELPKPVGELEVECDYYTVTVPNHVHLMRAVRGSQSDQAVFDLSFSKTTLRFGPPSGGELAIRQFLTGMLRGVGGGAQILFLAALALAARSRRELAALAGAFVAGEIGACVVAPAVGFQAAPAFIEAAAALTIAYLAVEILLLPQARRRWLVVGVLGIFHGLYFELFLRTSGYSTVPVLAGGAVSELLLLALLAILLAKAGRLVHALQPVRVCAAGLLVVALSWFVLRLRG